MIGHHLKRAGKLTFCAVFSLFVTACQTPRPVLVLPPAELSTCSDEPEGIDLPERDGTAETQLTRDQMTLAYILLLRSAYGDCKSKVNGLAAWRETAGD